MSLNQSVILAYCFQIYAYASGHGSRPDWNRSIYHVDWISRILNRSSAESKFCWKTVLCGELNFGDVEKLWNGNATFVASSENEKDLVCTKDVDLEEC